MTIALAPTGGATGVANVFAPTATELVYGGARGFRNASPAISWNDLDIGVQESERTTDPSLADDSTYEDFGQKNYGGSMSFYYPGAYGDSSNELSVIYDATKNEWTKMDVVQRIDGTKPNNTAIATGDFVHGMRTITDGEQNSLTGSDALRRTVNFRSQGEVSIYTVVGPHTLTAVPAATTPWKTATKNRLRVTIANRDVTNMDTITFTSSNPTVVSIDKGGFYTVLGAAAATATITITDTGAGTSTTQAVTVTA